MKKHTRRHFRRVDMQVFLFTAALIILACATIFLVCYTVTYQNTIDTLSERVEAIYGYVEHKLDPESFTELRSKEALTSELYTVNQGLLARAKEAAGVRYLYTATRTETGAFIYLLDGLPLDAGDFRYPGDPIEPEIVPELERAMAGEEIWPSDIKPTEWGKIFIAYLPVHDGNKIVGVVGVEFDAESPYNTFYTLRMAAPLIILAACIVAAALAVLFFRRISNPTRKDLYNTDQLTQLKSRNAFDVDFENLNVQRDRRIIGIILADLNYLKQVNDVLGHQMGDDYLKRAADALRETCPHTGAAYRIGGDELAIVLWDTTAEETGALVQQLCACFTAHRPGWTIDTSLAVGYAIYEPERDRDLYDTFKRADEVLYSTKAEQHRNQ